MPAEPTKAKRRTSRRDLEEYKFDGTHARELEMKRNRGEVSCAECRRLKIKCDKQIPCQSCQRRGCAALCPNGSLATGQGTRFVLAATEHLHRKLAKLSGRIRQLEDALSALQAKHSTEPHPLLHEDLLSANIDERDDDGLGMVEDTPGPPSSAPEVIDAFGTLSISDHGISRFFGPTGGSESLLMANLNASHPSSEPSHTPESIRSSRSPPGPSELSLFSQSFPFTPMGRTTDVQELVESHLPTWERANFLCETYFEQVAWIFRGVTREQLIDDMLPAVYRKYPHEQHFQGGPEEYNGPHDLSLLFIIFAIGALVEPESSTAQAEHFHQISRAAICLQPVLEKPSIVTIQTLHLMSIYNAMSGSDMTSETSMEFTWSLITLAAHLSQTIGLHRDSARWGLSPKMVQRRRILFWDLFVADVWQSLNTGRPPSFSLAYIDCSFPQYGENIKDQDGESGPGFESWGFRFAAECVAAVASRTLTAEAPSYATIMELDRKVREFPLPPLPDRAPPPPGQPANLAQNLDLAASFQRCVLDHIRETILLYIHRSFFAQAIIEQPINPLKSAYAPSFLAAYRASSTILKSVREQFNMWPNSCARFWTMWTFAFSAAVVFGTVVTRGPRSPLATSAMAELEQACILFSKAAVYSKRATKALPILTKLSEKARYALATAQSDPAPLSGDKGGLLWNIKQEDTTDDELDIFAGRTRLVSGRRPSPPSSSNSSSQGMRYETTQTVYARDPQAQPPLRRQEQQPLVSSDPYCRERTSMANNWAPEPHHEEYMPPPPPIVHTRAPPLHYHPVSQYSPTDQTRRTDGYNYAWPQDSRQQPHQQYQGHPSQTHTTTQFHPDQYQQQPHHSQHQVYATTPAFHGSHTQPPNSELADLGLAARDSRLDERWSSFMQDSGLLEGINFRTH